MLGRARHAGEPPRRTRGRAAERAPRGRDRAAPPDRPAGGRTRGRGIATISRMVGNGTPPATGWDIDPAVLAPIAVWATVWLRRFPAARREAGGRGAGPVQMLAFTGSLVVLLAAVASPIDSLGDRLFTMHMVQHLLLGDLAPLLCLLALSRVMMRPATRRLMRVERALGRFAHPLTGLGLWLGLVYLWHIPALYGAALDHPLVHALEHASFFLAGTAVWWPLIQPVPMRRRLTGMAPFAYIAAAKLGLGGLGLFLVWSSVVAYEHYAQVPRTWGLTAIADQNIGGAVMMVEQSMLLVVVLSILFVRMLAQSEEEERRRERLEEAAAT